MTFMQKAASLAIAMLVIVVATGRPLAKDKNTNTLIRQAYSQYADQEFESALKILNQANQVKGNSRVQLVKIYHLQGLCLGSLGYYPESKRAFARALSLDPAFRLGFRVAPRIRKPFQELLKSKPRPFDVQVHAPTLAEGGKPMVMVVQVMSDPEGMAKSIRLGFSRGSHTKYSYVRARVRGSAKYRIKIPVLTWEGGKGWKGPVYWLAVVEDEHGGRLQEIGKADNPYSIKVQEDPNAPAVAFDSNEDDKDTAWYKQWWVWTIIGGLAAAGATTAVVLTTGSPDTPGPARFSLEFSTSP